ncbi:MAG: FAD-dependent oxidoreductase [Nitrospirae bacterium]|nr:FAD-dependent oxidoreductase [Nitrospirota bacterium]
MIDTPESKNTTIILGGGLTGLSAGHRLSSAGRGVTLFERDHEVGGLSRTIETDGYRFDLGGHRFFTKDERTNAFVRDLMGDELIAVGRSSKIYLRDRFFDYPLKPVNALFGLGIPTTVKAIADYGLNRLRSVMNEKEIVSLEDWVVSKFGRTMFNIYFREYSEKVWGIGCDRISAEWVAQRIKGLSLSGAIKNAFFRVSGRELPTLADSFLYPELGIGRISDRLKEEIEKSGMVYTGTSVGQVNHDGRTVESVFASNRSGSGIFYGREFISSVPLPALVRMLNPLPPEDVLKAASMLRFRDLVVVAVMVDRAQVTDQTWIYVPEKKIPFGRIHEPTNWSRKMAPEGKSLLVMEFFSFRGDGIWNESDGRLVDITIENLKKLGFIKREEAVGSQVIRVPRAYPLFEVGYEKPCEVIMKYLERFTNLHIAGRSGMFRYYNMDHAIESGVRTADKVMDRKPVFETAGDGGTGVVMAGSGL